jgi:hypothetical protein
MFLCEPWTLTLRKKKIHRMFEDRALRGIFEPKRERQRENNRKVDETA